jgi:quercetin dioxygenase-like cupin family protein
LRTQAEGSPDGTGVDIRPMIIPRVWTDEQGTSHFADLDLPETMMPTAIGLPEMRSTSSLPAENFRLITTTPQAMARGWHPAPARQFVIVVRGSIAVEVSDGETRQLVAGSMIFFEDVGGRGHLNRVVDDGEIMLAFLVVPEHWSPPSGRPESFD